MVGAPQSLLEVIFILDNIKMSLHGWVKSTYQSGNTYFGEFKNGKMECVGKWTFSDGRVLEGYFIDNEFFKAAKVDLPKTHQPASETPIVKTIL